VCFFLRLRRCAVFSCSVGDFLLILRHSCRSLLGRAHDVATEIHAIVFFFPVGIYAYIWSPPSASQGYASSGGPAGRRRGVRTHNIYFNNVYIHPETGKIISAFDRFAVPAYNNNTCRYVKCGESDERLRDIRKTKISPSGVLQHNVYAFVPVKRQNCNDIFHEVILTADMQHYLHKNIQYNFKYQVI